MKYENKKRNIHTYIHTYIHKVRCKFIFIAILVAIAFSSCHIIHYFHFDDEEENNNFNIPLDPSTNEPRITSIVVNNNDDYKAIFDNDNDGRNKPINTPKNLYKIIDESREINLTINFENGSLYNGPVDNCVLLSSTPTSKSFDDTISILADKKEYTFSVINNDTNRSNTYYLTINITKNYEYYVSASTTVVPMDGSQYAPFNKITTALKSVENEYNGITTNNDITIKVAAIGEYTDEDINYGLSSIPSNIKIKIEGGYNYVKASSEWNAPTPKGESRSTFDSEFCIEESNLDITIENFVMKRGISDNYSNLVIKNCLIDDKNAEGSDCTIYNNATMSIENTIVECYNRYITIKNSGSVLEIKESKIYGCKVDAATATYYTYICGVFNSSGNITIDKSTIIGYDKNEVDFASNISIYGVHNGSGTIEIKNGSKITGCDGGSVSASSNVNIYGVYGSNNGKITIENSEITGCKDTSITSYNSGNNDLGDIYGVCNNGETNITGGVVKGADSDSICNINGNIYGLYNNGKLREQGEPNLNGTKIIGADGKVAITNFKSIYGLFNDAPYNFLIAGATITGITGNASGGIVFGVFNNKNLTIGDNTKIIGASGDAKISNDVFGVENNSILEVFGDGDEDTMIIGVTDSVERQGSNGNAYGIFSEFAAEAHIKSGKIYGVDSNKTDSFLDDYVVGIYNKNKTTIYSGLCRGVHIYGRNKNANPKTYALDKFNNATFEKDNTNGHTPTPIIKNVNTSDSPNIWETDDPLTPSPW